MGFQIKQEKFEGPLELLLELIEKEKLSISEISLAKVTDQYLAYVRSLEKIDPEALVEFLVVAAQLMLIKSRSLLPSLKFTEEEEASIEELENRLAEYKKIKELAAGIKRLEGEKRHIFTREAYTGMEGIFYPPKEVTPELLMRTFKAVVDAIPKVEKIVEEKIRKIISLEEKISQIKSLLQSKVEQTFSEVVKGSKEKIEIIVSFLAILELAKTNLVFLSQKKSFGEIILRRMS